MWQLRPAVMRQREKKESIGALMMETLGTIISWLLDFVETAGISENGHHTTARHPQAAIEARPFQLTIV